MSDKLQYLFLLPPKFRKGISRKKNNWFYFLLFIVLVCFGATRIQIYALSGSRIRNRSGSGAKLIRIRLNVVDPGGSGPGSETLPITYMIPRSVGSDSFFTDPILYL